jgi:L-threonylcarbamoyladenylate synthase
MVVLVHLEQERSVKKAAGILRRGGLVAFPTETVYGLGARGFDGEAVARIFSVKGRPFDNPLIVHIADREQLQLLSPEVPAMANDLIKAFWPGPLTLVLKRLDTVPAMVSAGFSTIAVRMPNHPMALSLIRELNEPIAAPSANRSGRPSPTTACHVREELGATIDFILDGGPCAVGLESTVLDVTSTLPRILRPGAITEERLRAVIGAVDPYSELNLSVSSPGQKHPHYAPALKMILVEPDQWQVALQETQAMQLGVISLHKAVATSSDLLYCRVMTDLSDYAKNLFSAFYEAESAGVQILFVEKVPKEGLGVAIMDRLERAVAASQKSKGE